VFKENMFRVSSENHLNANLNDEDFSIDKKNTFAN